MSFIYLLFLLLTLLFSSVTQSCPTLCDPMDCSMPGFPGHCQLPEPAQTHVRQLNNAILPFHALSSPSLPALNLSQHQGLFQWFSSSHQVAKVFELQHQLLIFIIWYIIDHFCFFDEFSLLSLWNNTFYLW